MNEVEGAIDLLTPIGAAGWLWYPHAPETAARIELRIAGVTRSIVTANLYRDDVRKSGRGTGKYGFSVSIDPAANADDVEIIVRIGHREIAMTRRMPSLVGCTTAVSQTANVRSDIGFVDECSDQTVRGWAWNPQHPASRLDLVISIDGMTVTTVKGDIFRADLIDVGVGDGAHGFEYRADASLRGKRISVFSPELAQTLPIADEQYQPAAAIPSSGRMRIGQRRHALARIFDEKWYVREYPEAATSGLSPFDHYVEIGALRGYDPHYLFSSSWYARQSELDGVYRQFPTLHYIDRGSKAGLSPHPLFQVAWYRDRHRLSGDEDQTLIEHFLAQGQDLSLATTPLFDSQWYFERYPDVQMASVNAFDHYASMGYREGRSPNAFFDYDFYVERYPDIRLKQRDALAHYILHGAADMADPSPSFSTRDYLAHNSDVLHAGLNPLVHYLLHGRHEGRSPGGQQAPQSGALPRFSGMEYGPIQLTLPYDGPSRETDDSLKICVHLHLFHIDLADEMSQYLQNIGSKFTLLLSIRNEEIHYWRNFFVSRIENIERCIVKYVYNAGRDVSPWVINFSDEILKHDIFFHIHTKKSSYSEKYVNWRRFLLHCTVGTRSITSAILEQFANNIDIGLIYPPYFPQLNHQPVWGDNLQKAQALGRRLGSEAPAKCPDYPAGSFFWARVDYLRPLLTSGLTLTDFEEETGQVDGTMAHAIERMLGCLPSQAPFRKICANVDVAFDLTHYWDRRRADMAYPATGTAPPPARTTRPLGSGRKVAVYTALMGDFDEFVPPVHVHDNVDYFIFSDRDVGDVDPFVQRSPRYTDVNDRRTARFVKTHPALYMPDHDMAIWIDANIVMLSGLQPFLDIMDETDADLGVVRHSVRSSYVEEAAECVRIGADERSVIEEQVARYRAVGASETGLIETNFMIARLDRPQVRAFYNLWWREIASHSLRDQISVNFAADQAGLKVVSLLRPGTTVRDDGRFVIFEHALKNRGPALAISAGAAA